MSPPLPPADPTAPTPVTLGGPLLRSPAGLGEICVIDYVPRVLSRDPEHALQTVARLVVAQMDSRRRDLAAGPCPSI